MGRLLTEEVQSFEFLKESVNGEKQYYIQGIFIQGNVKNKNGRVYPLDILQKEVARYIKEEIQQDRAVGELGHPTGPTINLDKVSHKILSLKQEGTNFIGKAIILDTDNGIRVKRLIDGKVKLAVSTRGVGTVKHYGDADRVQEDFRLATVDIVHNPSAPNAYVTALMEDVEWEQVNGVWVSTSALNEDEILKNFDLFLKTI